MGEVYRRGLMVGADGGRFDPQGVVSRGQAVQTLYNLAGKPAAQADLAYADVSEDAWYAPAVRWADDTGVAVGYGDGRFGPGDPITREQLALMLWRYAGGPEGSDGAAAFADAGAVSGWAAEAMVWAAEAGILTGRPGDRLAPQATATRAELAAALARYVQALAAVEEGET